MSIFHLPYALVDVFAERALEGNMLAICTDARRLSTEQMQALARETNLAETTFIFPAEDPETERRDGVRVRIFTTQEELPFAGHPTLGTASWLYFNHPLLRGAEVVTLKLNVGPISVRFDAPTQDRPGVFGTMRQNDPVFGMVHDREEIARVLHVPIEDLDNTYPIQTVSTGMAFCIVPFKSLQALARLEIPQAAAQVYLDGCKCKFFYCLARVDSANADFHARMQFYNGEDPATGSGAGCAISWMVRHGLVVSGVTTVIEQGIEIRRPSRLYVRASSGAAKIHDVFVGGRTISVASGTFFLP